MLAYRFKYRQPTSTFFIDFAATALWKVMEYNGVYRDHSTRKGILLAQIDIILYIWRSFWNEN